MIGQSPLQVGGTPVPSAHGVVAGAHRQSCRPVSTHLSALLGHSPPHWPLAGLIPHRGAGGGAQPQIFAPVELSTTWQRSVAVGHGPPHRPCLSGFPPQRLSTGGMQLQAPAESTRH